MEIAPFQPVDMISTLPHNVMDNILTRLTLRDAVKTSILSKQWRYKWTNLPQLIIDDTLWQESEGNQESARTKFTLILFQLLLFHRGPITKFTLILPELRGYSEIDHLIYFLSKNGVEEFAFEIQAGYKLPSSLFMCLQLEKLSLCSCVINPPPSFKGFNRLIRLELSYVSIDTGVLGNLISSCPLLEQLVLQVPTKFDHLEIDAPMLKLFELTCNSTSFSFKKSPLLAIISIAADLEELPMGDGICNFVKLFDSVPTLQELRIDYNFAKVLAADHIVQTKVLANKLKILELSAISLDILDELSCVICFIRSFPNLEKLNIMMFPDEADDTSDLMDFLKMQDYSSVSLNRLQDVKLEYITGKVSEMALIKLLLEKSLKLRRMVISVDANRHVDKELLLKELNKFWHASPNAEVNIEGL